jgi:DNA-binding NtrC family response regulator
VTRFLTLPALIAILSAAIGTAAALLLVSLAPGPMTALDRLPFDHWARRHADLPASMRMLAVVRDRASETRLGSGPWDRELLARTVTVLDRAGAAAIGIDFDVLVPSAPGSGGATSDALLLEALNDAHHAVVQVAPDARDLPSFAAAGHGSVPADPDGVIRRLPIAAETGPAPFSAALAAVMAGEPGARTLIRWSRTVPTVSFTELWDAMSRRDEPRLRAWAGDRIVVLLASPDDQRAVATPIGPRPLGEVHVQALNTRLASARAADAPSAVAPIAGAAAAALAAAAVVWLPLGAGLLASVAVVLLYLAVVLGALWGGWLVLPWVAPTVAALLAGGTGMAWQHITSGLRIHLLEGRMLRIQDELSAARQSLLRRESRVEVLQEDLEAARAVAARSAGEQRALAQSMESLRSGLSEAQTQEAATRQRLRELEAQLAGLRAASVDRGALTDAEQERVRQECDAAGIVTRDARMLALFRDLKKGARTTIPILILGELGTGKELVARAAHRLSPRAAGPFVPVNMAAISPELVEAELFGHVKGSFTGALNDRKGYFEQAHRGTLFLDEIGDLRLEHQGKLLRVLQDHAFFRVGDTQLTRVDVRIVAATNKDLQRGVAEGWFREDLYFRLKGLVLRLPPLRERPADIALLAQRFVREAAEAAERKDIALSADALAALQAHPWRGNIRELRHCLEHAVTLAEGSVLTPADLPLALPAAAAGAPSAAPDAYGDQAVLEMLRRYEFDMQATARALGWDRSTVTQRLKGLSFQAVVEADGDVSKAALALAGGPTLAAALRLKITEYVEHLLTAARGCAGPDEAIAACRKRFKNLPDRHFKAVEILIRRELSKQR